MPRRWRATLHPVSQPRLKRPLCASTRSAAERLKLVIAGLVDYGSADDIQRNGSLMDAASVRRGLRRFAGRPGHQRDGEARRGWVRRSRLDSQGGARQGGTAQRCPTRRSPNGHAAQTDSTQGRPAGSRPNPTTPPATQCAETGPGARAASLPDHSVAATQSQTVTTAARASGPDFAHRARVGFDAGCAASRLGPAQPKSTRAVPLRGLARLNQREARLGPAQPASGWVSRGAVRSAATLPRRCRGSSSSPPARTRRRAA